VKQNLKEGDILISKDSNIGEVIILDKDYSNFMTSGAIYKLPIIQNKYYLLAFLKHNFFRQQLDFMVPKGATIRHAKTLFLDCKIPYPNKNQYETIKYVEVLTQAIINKEKLIKKRHKTILGLIEKELTENQKADTFNFELPKIKEIEEIGRLDTGLYSKIYKNTIFKITNYKNGYKNIFELGFKLSRGQNLQVSNIGISIYSNQKYDNFYTLGLPTNISDYGTIDKLVYLGSNKKLKILNKGEIIFGAEATFRSFVVCNDNEKFITNIHGVTLYNQDFEKSIFIKCFLDYLVNTGVIDCIKVGGNGGSFAQKYWYLIQFPLFPESKQKEISNLYHNNEISYDTKNCTLDNFLDTDNKYNETVGIVELDKGIKKLQTELNIVLVGIVNNKEVKITFNFDE
jgi:type I restriction enzyme S subunit